MDASPESRELKKIRRKLEVLSHRADVVPIARQIFCDSGVSLENSAAPVQELGRISQGRTGKFLVFVGLGLSFGSWVYVVMNPAPSFLFGSILLFFMSLCFLVAAWELFGWRILGKLLSALVMLVLFVVAEYSWDMHIGSLAAKAAQAQKDADQKEVYLSLMGQMEYGMNTDPLNSVFTYTNNSSLQIVLDQISVESRQLSFGNERNPLIGELDHDKFDLAMNGQIIEGGGDGQTDALLKRIAAKNMGNSSAYVEISHPLSCADLIVEMDYRLTTQPNLKRSKSFRYVTEPTRTGPKWEKIALDSSGSLCRAM